jgi:hypothetical protein
MKKIGFWKNNAYMQAGYEEVVKAWKDNQKNPITSHEYEAIMTYIEESKIYIAYLGWASCRGCGKELGCCDMITPDKKFIFPEKYEHYISIHQIRPPDDFINMAVQWYDK